MPVDASLAKNWPCCGAAVIGPSHDPNDDVSPHEAYLQNKQLCVNVLVWHPTDIDLCCVVSRKDDRKKFCFPGGKVDPGDWPPPSAVLGSGGPQIVMAACVAGAVRETREESGLIVRPEDLHFAMGSSCFDDGRKNNRYAACFVAKAFTGSLGTTEPIDVLWAPVGTAVAGPFGDLYERVLTRIGRRWR